MSGVGGQSIENWLQRFGFDFCTTRALISSNQLSVLDIKLLFFANDPFMEATAAQGIAFMPLGYCLPLKLNYITHDFSLMQRHDYFLAMAFHAASHVCDR